jgi:hypothetical protein
MSSGNTKTVAMLRVGYWIGIVLDALAFAQMAFPELGRRLLQSSMSLETDYIFAINLGAGLMLAWTLLLFWADRKPMERSGILPLTMIIIVWNNCTLIFGIKSGLFPARAILPQIVLSALLFVYYGICSVLAFHPKATKT